MSLGERIARAAAADAGRQYRKDDCAYAVSNILQHVGANLRFLVEKLHGNANWVPNYADFGRRISQQSSLELGDLVIFNWKGLPPNPAPGGGGYDHIGIYGGNGRSWNVSTANGYQWTLTTISFFQEARRVTESDLGMHNLVASDPDTRGFVYLEYEPENRINPEE